LDQLGLVGEPAVEQIDRDGAVLDLHGRLGPLRFNLDHGFGLEPLVVLGQVPGQRAGSSGMEDPHKQDQKESLFENADNVSKSQTARRAGRRPAGKARRHGKTFLYRYGYAGQDSPSTKRWLKT